MITTFPKAGIRRSETSSTQSLKLKYSPTPAKVNKWRDLAAIFGFGSIQGMHWEAFGHAIIYTPQDVNSQSVQARFLQKGRVDGT